MASAAIGGGGRLPDVPVRSGSGELRRPQCGDGGSSGQHSAVLRSGLARNEMNTSDGVDQKLGSGEAHAVPGLFNAQFL
jgi:hypothetical protein